MRLRVLVYVSISRIKGRVLVERPVDGRTVKALEARSIMDLMRTEFVSIFRTRGHVREARPAAGHTIPLAGRLAHLELAMIFRTRACVCVATPAAGRIMTGRLLDPRFASITRTKVLAPSTCVPSNISGAM